MALSEIQIELIGKYISNSLSESENKEFRKFLDNEKFRNELLLQGQMVDSLNDLNDNELKDFLKSDLKKDSDSKTSFFLEPYLKYAAIFVLLIAALFLFKQFSGDSETVNLALIEKHNSTFPAELVQRGAASEMSQEYKMAMSIYANQKYENAYAAFNGLKEQSPKIQLYKANSLIELKKFDEAIVLLKTIGGNDIINNDIAENRDWYLAIAYLGNNELKECKLQLTQIINSNAHAFNHKAKTLIKALNE